MSEKNTRHVNGTAEREREVENITIRRVESESFPSVTDPEAEMQDAVLGEPSKPETGAEEEDGNSAAFNVREESAGAEVRETPEASETSETSETSGVLVTRSSSDRDAEIGKHTESGDAVYGLLTEDENEDPANVAADLVKEFAGLEAAADAPACDAEDRDETVAETEPPADIDEEPQAFESEEKSTEEEDVHLREDTEYVVVSKPHGLPKRTSPVVGPARILLSGFLLLWIAVVLLVPFFLPRGVGETQLPLLSAGHLLGTNERGKDILYLTLLAGRRSLIQAMMPAGVGILGIALTYRSQSGSSTESVRCRGLIFHDSVPVIALFLFFALSFVLPRSWTYGILLFFLSAVLWLRESGLFARYLGSYRRALPNQYDYYLGAGEMQGILLSYGREIRAASVASILRIFIRAYLIMSVLPLADRSLNVPEEADWAGRILLSLKQGAEMTDPSLVPQMIAWLLTLGTAVAVMLLHQRIAVRRFDAEPLRRTRSVWR